MCPPTPPQANPDTCPRCDQPTTPGRSTCLTCGFALAAPEEAAPPPAPAPAAACCPRCRVDMNEVTIGFVTVDVCAGCGGAWYDHQEFETHLNSVQAAREARIAAEGPPEPNTDKGPMVLTNPTLEYLPCARCGQQMLRRNFDGGSGVILDVCGDHGTFVDAGELAAIVRYLESPRREVVARLRAQDEARQQARAATAGQRRTGFEPYDRWSPRRSVIIDALDLL